MAILDDTVILVDDTAPTLADIIDNQGGGPVNQNALLTYTVTFSEDMDVATFSATDLGDAGGDVAITIGAIVTLFAVMQLTGRLDWKEAFATRSRSAPT